MGRADELAKEKLTSWEHNGKACEGCIFSKGTNPMEAGADKCSCMIFAYPSTKPDSVFIEGKPCKYRRTREDTDKLIKEAGNG